MEPKRRKLSFYKKVPGSKSIKSMDVKHYLAAPYHFFLSGIKLLPETYNEDLTITFPELLDQSLGHLEFTLHVNFMVDLRWLFAQYAINNLNNPSMIILYGVDDEDLIKIPSHLKVTAIKIKSPYPFGHHHSKLSIFFYRDKSLRFAVYTANLIESDWEDRTQGIIWVFMSSRDINKRICLTNIPNILPMFPVINDFSDFIDCFNLRVWLSPKCPYLGDDVPINYGESETLFKLDILHYLNSYHLPQLRDCLMRIQKTNCSSIKVCLVASIPGEHEHDWGYRKLSKLIKKHASHTYSLPLNLIAQCSSIGSLGPSPFSWLLGEFCENLCQTKIDKVRVIYPSLENVKNSISGILGGACLPYSSRTHGRQTWLNQHLMQWKSDSRRRSKAVPHIKTYAHVSSNATELFWFLLSSANLSKAAWGAKNKADRLFIRSYEVGVVFFPVLLVGDESFVVKQSGLDSNKTNREFPLPYDLPLTCYRSTDEIFLYDKHFPR